MGVEVMNSKQSHVSAEGNSSMKFGSVSDTPVKGELKKDHEANVPNNGSVKGELNKAPEVNVPNNVREEWPEPTEIHSFYVVKYRSYDDHKLKALVEQADKELQKIYRARSAVVEKLRPLKADRQQLMSQIIPLNTERRQFRAVIDEKRKEKEPLKKNLGQLRNTMGVCSSEQELDAYLKGLQYRIQHESITLNEEKQILREIKQLESTREKVIANSAARAKIEESVGDKEALQEQVKLIDVDLDGVKKAQGSVKLKLEKLEVEKNAIDEKIKFLEEELKDLDKKKENANKGMTDLRNRLREVNAPFYQNADLLKNFRARAAQKDIESLKQHTEAEVDKFVSQWTSRKDFREDYERRILLSLDMRQLSRDGRMRNSDEKPLVQPSKVAPAEAVVKQPREGSALTQKTDAASTEKVPKEKVSKVQKEANNKKKDGILEKSDNAVEKGADADFEIIQNVPPKVKEVDEEKLKEIKREEEIAKNRQALERKKKLAEKAAAKAAIKAQKDAEEKQKKKAKKKAGTTGTTAESQEESNETEGVELEVAEEAEHAEEKIEQAVPQKRERKESVVKKRTRSRGTGSLPKAILKRKKATNYLPYAAAAAALAVILLFVVGYKYFV